MTWLVRVICGWWIATSCGDFQRLTRIPFGEEVHITSDPVHQSVDDYGTSACEYYGYRLAAMRGLCG
jgi:hypothetical protein